MKTRRLYQVIDFTASLDSSINTNQLPEAISEVFFRKPNSKCFNCRKPKNHINFQTIGISDASSTGYAANLTISNVKYTTAYESLFPEESQKGSNWREISTTQYALKAFAHFLKNTSVLWKGDNYESTFITSSAINSNNILRISDV